MGLLEKILMIEEVPLIRSRISAFLEDSGFRVLQATVLAVNLTLMAINERNRDLLQEIVGTLEEESVDAAG